VVNHLGSQAKFGESDIVVEDLENYFNGHANLDVGWVWVGDDQIARHAGAFFQLDDNWHIRGFVAEGRSGPAMDDREGVDDALATLTGDGELLLEAEGRHEEVNEGPGVLAPGRRPHHRAATIGTGHGETIRRSSRGPLR